MNDKEIADAVVLLGVADGPNNYNAYSLFSDVMDWMPIPVFIHDWRVAGALMEMIPGNELRVLTFGQAVSAMKIGDSICRAIIEACVEALS